METGICFIERRESTGICLRCGGAFANIRDSEGRLLDDLLEEGQPLWAFRPVQLTADDVHSKAILGEWCGVRCFVKDLRSALGRRAVRRGGRPSALEPS